MGMITAIYALNSTLLLLHEIESAYEKEWEILKLPGRITGFLLIHFPLILLVLYGLIEINKYSVQGLIFGIVLGICGIIPFLVHKVILRKEGHFNLLISNIIIFFNILTGIALVCVSICYLLILDDFFC